MFSETTYAARSLVRLTQYGTHAPIWIDPAKIIYIIPALEGGKVTTRIAMDWNISMEVEESLDEVMKRCGYKEKEKI